MKLLRFFDGLELVSHPHGQDGDRRLRFSITGWLGLRWIDFPFESMGAAALWARDKGWKVKGVSKANYRT